MLKKVEVRKVLSRIVREQITTVVGKKASEDEIVKAIQMAGNYAAGTLINKAGPIDRASVEAILRDMTRNAILQCCRPDPIHMRIAVQVVRDGLAGRGADGLVRDRSFARRRR
jgi:hypothetical protein